MPGSIIDVADLLGLSGPSCSFWRAVLCVLFGLPLTEEQRELARIHTGRTKLFDGPLKQCWLAVGRRGGKSRVLSLIAVFLACFCDHSAVLAPGETGSILLCAPSMRQARVLLGYITGFLRSTPMLAKMIASETELAVELSNGIVVEVRAANFKTIRGFTVIAALIDEMAFLPQDDSAVPDSELLAAVQGAMGSIPNSLLICSSTPYAQSGEMHAAYRAHFAVDDSDVGFFNASTLVANPAMDVRVVERAFAADPSAAASEYGSDGFVRFRADIERLISAEAYERCVDYDRPLILPPCFDFEEAE